VSVTAAANTDPGFSKPQIERWPTEVPLFLLSVLVSIPIWIGLIVSIVGFVYLCFIALFLFAVHLGFVAHVRGSGVRVGPEQLPELDARVQRLAHDMGIAKMPAIYVVQAGGTLNALATKFLRSHIVVLFAELLDACGDDEAARDMIIAHELGHIHAGHLAWRWLIAPSMLVPLLPQALSRAREYTCDRYGVRGAGNLQGAVHGLVILAAGPKQADRVNRTAFVKQDSDLQTGWMTIGSWFATHPPLARRVAAVDPGLGSAVTPSNRGMLRAFAILGSLFVPLVVAIAVLAWKLPHMGLFKPPDATIARGSDPAPGHAAVTARAVAPHGTEPAAQEGSADDETEAERPAPPLEEGKKRAAQDFVRIARLIEAERSAGRPIPWNDQALQRLWAERESGPFPEDPFDGTPYGYDRNASDYLLFSVGPDREVGTADDLVFDSREHAAAPRPASVPTVKRITVQAPAHAAAAGKVLAGAPKVAH
jgi:Zn-dependent protease with chaperone function